MQLENKHVLLTGATGGIGQAIAKELANKGATIILAGRNEEKLEQLRQALSGDHQTIAADISRDKGRKELLQRCQQTGLDLCINAAGILDFQLYDKQDTDCIEQMISTNLVSPMLLCHQLIPLLRQSREAAIINIGSIFGSIGHPGFTTYCASKFGLRGFTEALQRELADTSIKVFYLAPRATRTGLNSDAVTALNEALGNAVDTPEQVAREVITLLSGRRLQHFSGWPEKLFVRLNSVFPGIVHNALVKKLPIIRHHADH